MQILFRFFISCFFGLFLIIQKTDAQQIRVSVISNSTGNSPLWVAQEMGFFQDEGLDVAVAINQDSNYQLEMLANGGFEFTHQAVDHFMREIERGSDFVIIHSLNRPTFDLISRPELKTFNDLNGKIVALDNVETGYWLLYRKVLQKYGVNPGDYTLLANLGGSRNRLKAVRENRAQFTHMNAPASIQAEKDGFNILTNLSDHYPNFPASSIGTRRVWAMNNRDTVIAYLRAYIRASEWLFDPANREAAIEIGVGIGHDRELLPGSFERFINKGLVKYGSLTEEGINQVGELLIESKVIDSFGDMDKYADTSYQLEAKRQLLEEVSN
jgi:ABC-type nitrate/sulfonate/bicarbonate transport system substrate-binding protein